MTGSDDQAPTSYPDHYPGGYPSGHETQPDRIANVTEAGARVSFQVATPDRHRIATTADAALATATALAVARHHRLRFALITASDGRTLEVRADGGVRHHHSVCGAVGWPSVIERTAERLAAPAHDTQRLIGQATTPLRPERPPVTSPSKPDRCPAQTRPRRNRRRPPAA